MNSDKNYLEELWRFINEESGFGTIRKSAQITHMTVDSMSDNFKGFNTGIGILTDPSTWRKPSVLDTSSLGENLHQLLAEKDHPLTNTALAYIRELEERVQEEASQRKKQQEKLNKLLQVEEENKKLKRENTQLKKNSYKRR